MRCEECGNVNSFTGDVCNMCAAEEITKSFVRVDPTPEEIKIRCAEIRAGWSEKEERQRRVGYDNSPVTIPVVSLKMSDYYIEEAKD